MKKRFLLFLAAFVLLSAAGLFRNTYFVDSWLMGEQAIDRAVTVIAHRGASGDAPENTLAAIELAIRQGADVIEFDVRQSKDEEVILMHDATVDRTTNLSGSIGSFTTEQLRNADAGSWFSKAYAGQHAPTLQEAMDITAGQVILNIEVKEAGVEKRIVELIQQYDAHSWCEIITFKRDVIKRIAQLDSSIKQHELAAAKLPTGDLSMFGVGLHYHLVTRAAVSEFKEKGLGVHCWTVNDTNNMRKLIAMGVDGITTDHPQRLIDLLPNE